MQVVTVLFAYLAGGAVLVNLLAGGVQQSPWPIAHNASATRSILDVAVDGLFLTFLAVTTDFETFLPVDHGSVHGMPA